jgi:hypothetical protein
LPILDDLFIDAGKDKGITDLYTKGSHHRSLSVIPINKNLFGSKDRIQRQNCDKLSCNFQQASRLTSHHDTCQTNYPGHTEILIKTFGKKNAKHIHSFLLLDLMVSMK